MFISKSVRLSAGCRAGEVQGGCVWVLVRVRLMAGSAGGRECARGWTFECELWVGLVETWEALSLLFEITAMLTQDCFIKQRMHCNRYDCFVALGANAYANIMSSCASVRAGERDRPQIWAVPVFCCEGETWWVTATVFQMLQRVWTPRWLLQGKHGQSKKSPHIFGAPGVNHSQIFVIQIHRREIPKNALDHRWTLQNYWARLVF